MPLVSTNRDSLDSLVLGAASHSPQIDSNQLDEDPWRAMEGALCANRIDVLKLLEYQHQKSLEDLKAMFRSHSRHKKTRRRPQTPTGESKIALHTNEAESQFASKGNTDQRCGNVTSSRTSSEQRKDEQMQDLNSISTCTTSDINSFEKDQKRSFASSDSQAAKKIISSGRIRSQLAQENGSIAKAIVSSHAFEIGFAFLIITNAIVMCVEAQYLGIDAGYELGCPNMIQRASDSWPQADVVFKFLDIFFGIAFAVELLLKLIVLRGSFCEGGWNIFDAILVLAWAFDTLFTGLLPVSPFVLRVFLLGRLLRLLRLVRTFQVFDTLHLIAASLCVSGSVLLWSVILLSGIMMCSALPMNSIISFYIADTSQAENNRMEAYLYFGSYSRSMLSIFEVTCGNFIPITRFLHENVSEYYGAVVMIYWFIVSFAVVMVIRGVFLHETFQVASNDDELMILRQKRVKTRNVAKVSLFFNELDDSQDGYLSYHEFMQVMSDDRVKLWLSAMGLEVADAELVFAMVDNGDNQITPEEFVAGFSTLKGHARCVDMVHTLRLVRNMVTMVESITQHVGVDFIGCKERDRPLVSKPKSLSAENDDIERGYRPEVLKPSNTFVEFGA